MLNKKITRRRNGKKIARLAACRLKRHETDAEGFCWTCFTDFWAKQPISIPVETIKRMFLKKMEALDDMP